MKVKELLNAYYGNEEIAVEVADTDIMRSTGIFHIDEVGKLKENWKVLGQYVKQKALTKL